MRYRRFGRTELAMPVFSCGGMRYQQSWQDLAAGDIQPQEQENVAATLRRAIAVGINHIETARFYGSSELQVGWVLPELPRDRLILQTKVAPQEDVGAFRQQLERSLGLLGVDRLDLLGIHGINQREHLDWTLRSRGCMEVVREFQKAGHIGHVGFSTHGPLEVILAAIASDQFDYVNLHWYYIQQANWPAIAAAQAHDMGVFIISPSNKGGNLYEPPPKLVDLCAPLSPMVFNNLFCLSHPEVHTLSIGAARPEDFDEHLKTLEVLDRADELLPPILERLENAAIAAFDREFGPGEGRRWLRSWHRGLPDPADHPDRVSIKTMVWLWNLIKAFDMVGYGAARYNLLNNGGHWFPGTRADQLDPAAIAPLVNDSPHRDRLLPILQETHDLLAGVPVQRLSQS
jgi:predicted aldo/keto reductase-like oxidoreductase